MFTEKILALKLQKYLGDIIINYNKNNYKDFLTNIINDIPKSKNPEDILRYFYFEKFFEFLKHNKIIEKIQVLNSNFKNEIEICVIENFKTSNLDKNNNYNSSGKIFFNFLRKYAKFDIGLLNLLYSNLSRIDDKFLLVRTSKVFLTNSYQNENWENFFKNKIMEIYIEDINSYYLGDSLSNKLIKHLKLQINNQRKIKDSNLEPLSSNTQLKLRSSLEKFGIKYEEEYERDGFIYDYYLPDLNAVMDYDGPDHFYPLQTQLDERHKFRYKDISMNYKSKIISIPYYELMRCDTTEGTNFYIRNKIFSKKNIFDSALFYENYDLFKH